MRGTTLEKQAIVIERWKARRGVVGREYVPSNSGLRRTRSKLALLQALREARRIRAADAAATKATLLGPARTATE